MREEVNISIVESFDTQDTFQIGKDLAKQAQAGEVFTLIGDLGVGKTVFTQGFAEGLEIDEPISSPTFTILQEYHSGRLALYHFDVYRIMDIDEMVEIGYEECIEAKGICLIEWAELIKEILPPMYTQIKIEKVIEKGFDYRKITQSIMKLREE